MAHLLPKRISELAVNDSDWDTPDKRTENLALKKYEITKLKIKLEVNKRKLKYFF